MKYLLLFVFLLAGFISKADDVSDTVTFWTITYGKTVIIHGSEVIKEAPRHELIVKNGQLKDLTVSFFCDACRSETSSLVVEEKNEILRTIPQHEELGSAYFIVPLRELISTHQPDVKYELDFYFTDGRGNKLYKLGTITFTF